MNIINILDNYSEEALGIKNGNPEIATIYHQEFIEKEDSLQYVPLIFENYKITLTLMTGIKILQKNINKNWESLPETQQIELRNFCFTWLSSFSSIISIHNQLEELIALIAIKDFPKKWINFLDEILLIYPPKFGIFSNFLYLLNNSDSSLISINQYNEIFNFIKNKFNIILN